MNVVAHPPTQWALVSGASSGIGKATVGRLLSAGFNVVASGRDAARVSAALSALPSEHANRVHVVAADLSTIEGPQALVAATLSLSGGVLHALVNNAGFGMLGKTLSEITAQDWDATFALNVRGPMLTLQAAIEALAAVRGVVINISSIAAARPLVGLSAYCAAKSSVEMLTKCAALELAPRGVRVICVAPGTVETNFHVAGGMPQAVAAQYYAASASTHPIGRVGTPDDVASLIGFLVGSDASWMTGTVVTVDGGRLLTMSTALQLASGASAK